MLKLYNTLTRKKEEFEPIKDGEVGIYTCGPTVYNHVHIGNLRAYTAADLLQRYLKYSGYKVKWVLNITDIEDKIIRDYKKSGKSLEEFTRYFEDLFFEDAEKINIRKVNFFKTPRATEHITEMQGIIKKLFEKGLAYESEGSIYFNIGKYQENGNKYGQLLNIDFEGLKEGARIDSDEYDKEDARDFVLWKAKKEEDEPNWDFEINEKNYVGRPGWHIECSAMSEKYLGQPFDIHTGGVDLIFPHHEDEIAQSVGATGKPLANYFVHNEHLLVDSTKMSKSLGNFYTLEDVMKMIKNPLSLRYLFLSTHYRSKLNFTDKSIKDAENTLNGIKDLLLRLKDVKNEIKNISGMTNPTINIGELVNNTKKEIEEAFDNDLNSPLVLSRMHSFISAVGSDQDVRNYTIIEAKEILDFLFELDEILGLGLKEINEEQLTQEIQNLINEREIARKNKDFKKADELRDQIFQKGFEIEDTPEGLRLKKIR